jgi:uncharacterized protein (TIGR03437 family)
MRLLLLTLTVLLPLSAGVNYTYDPSGRLVTITYGDGSTISYDYDKAGNVLARSTQGPNGPAITSVVVANGGLDLGQNTWIVIKGANLVPPTTPASGVIWNNAPDFAIGKLPIQLDGVGVTVNGNPAFVYFYCSAASSRVCASDQINVLTPLDNTIGPVRIVVTSGNVSSPPFFANMKALAPAFLLFNAAGSVAATHVNGTLLGQANLFPGFSKPAAPNETIVVYGVGFGLPATAIVNGSAAQSGTLSSNPVCQISGINAAVSFAGLIGPGLYQLNLTVPASAKNGENALSCSYSGLTTLPGALVSIQP